MNNRNKRKFDYVVELHKSFEEDTDQKVRCLPEGKSGTYCDSYVSYLEELLFDIEDTDE